MFSLSACSRAGDETERPGDAVPADRTVRFGTGTPLVTFDPHLADTGAPFETYLVLVYDGLTRLNTADFSKPYPGLAASWSWPDPTTVELQLRRDVRFIDGERFDAHAVKANIERLMRLEGPRINTVASMSAAEALDDFTLRLHLHYPDPTLLYNLGMSPGLMVSPAAFDNPDLDLDPVGTGPWRYDRANSAIGEVHRFVPNPDYHDPAFQDAPPIAIRPLVNNRARLNALISGQIDLAEVGPAEAAPALDRGFGISARSNGWLGLTILDRAGELVPELGDARVRQAIGFAVDRQAIADTVFLGYAPSAIPTSTPTAATRRSGRRRPGSIRSITRLEPRLEQLGREARRSLDQELRARHYREYFNIVVKQVLSLPLVHVDDIVVYDPDKLTGVRVDRYMLWDVRLRLPAETP